MYNFIEKETLMQPFVKLTEVIKEFNLQIEYAPEGYELYKIFQEGVNRAALQLTGFFDNFDSGRVQLIGGVEHIGIFLSVFWRNSNWGLSGRGFAPAPHQEPFAKGSWNSKNL